MTSKTILSAGCVYEAPSCDVFEVATKDSLMTDSLNGSIGEYTDDGNPISF